MKQILMVGKSSILDIGQAEDHKMMKDKLVHEEIASKFRGKLVKMMTDTVSKFDDYSISRKITQISLE